MARTPHRRGKLACVTRAPGPGGAGPGRAPYDVHSSSTRTLRGSDVCLFVCLLACLFVCLLLLAQVYRKKAERSREERVRARCPAPHGEQANKQTNKQRKGQAICWRTETKVTPSKDGAQAKRASERTSRPIWAVACAAALVEFCSALSLLFRRRCAARSRRCTRCTCSRRASRGACSSYRPLLSAGRIGAHSVRLGALGFARMRARVGKQASGPLQVARVCAGTLHAGAASALRRVASALRPRVGPRRKENGVFTIACSAGPQKRDGTELSLRSFGNGKARANGRVPPDAQVLQTPSSTPRVPLEYPSRTPSRTP
jgi:hypothetical protein